MKAKHITIKGVTKEGNKFRPSDWAERLYYALASYGPDKRMRFNPLVHIDVSDKYKSFIIDPQLEKDDPMTFDFLMDFANSNNLVITEEKPALAASFNASMASAPLLQAS